MSFMQIVLTSIATIILVESCLLLLVLWIIKRKYSISFRFVGHPKEPQGE